MGKMDQAMLAVFSLFARTWTPALNPGPFSLSSYPAPPKISVSVLSTASVDYG